ncbi:MAG: S8 family serine peptidase [Rhizobiales bacterium]|nr:S8 family serine peptidase [Hyphomicrobiales bacterium]
MSLRIAFTSAIRAVSRPYLVLPAALSLATLALLSPPAMDDASAQGFRMQGPRPGFVGGGFSAGGPSGRFPSARARRFSGRPFIHPKSGPRRRANGIVATVPGNGKGGMGMRGGPRRTGTTTDTRHPKGHGRHPKGHRRHSSHRFWPPIVVPGGTTVVAVPVPGPSAPPPNVRGGSRRPPSTPPAQSNRRPPANRPPAASVASTNWGRYVPNEVVVEVASGISPRTMDALLRRHRLTQLETVNLQFSGTSIRRLRINNRRSVPAVVRALAADRAIMAAQPNLLATLQDDVAAPAAAATDLQQYALARMRMPEAHGLANGDRVLIAVIDSGADTEHPELAGMILDTFDAIGTGDRVHAHGTSIVGAIAARARLRGTAPGAHILVARAFGPSRTSMDGTTTDIIKSLDWAMARGARIINMSFAGGRDPAVARRLNEARGRGIVLVAAAGNAGPNSAPLYPAANRAVIAVTATDDGDRIYRAANRGKHVAVAAPGVDLLLPTLGSDYRMTSGTSFSAAEVTGVIALMLERNPTLGPDAVRQALVSTARDLGAPGVDPQFGAGLVDAYEAVRSVIPATAAAGASPTTGSGGQ